MNHPGGSGLDVSVVIPVFNEEGNLGALRAELLPVLESLNESFEVVFIDDGSTDRSPEMLRQFSRDDSRIRVVEFVRNYGQQMAVTAGMRHARGRAVVIMDADLQSPPHHLPELLAKLREGHDIVYGERERISKAWYRRIGTAAANWAIRKMTGFPIPDSVSGFLALDRRLVDAVNQYDEHARYTSVLLAWLSYGRFASVPISRRPRARGESHYSFRQLTGLFLNLVTSFSMFPLRLGFVSAAIVAVMGGAVGTWWAFMFAAEGWRPSQLPFYAALLLFVGALQLAMMGIMGEYIGRIYREARRQPLYIVSAVYENGEKVQP